MAAYHLRRASLGWCFVALLKCHTQHSLAIKREGRSVSSIPKTLPGNWGSNVVWKHLHSKHKYRTAQTKRFKTCFFYKIEWIPTLMHSLSPFFVFKGICRLRNKRQQSLSVLLPFSNTKGRVWEDWGGCWRCWLNTEYGDFNYPYFCYPLWLQVI